MKKNKKSINYGKWGYLFILPFFIIYLIFSLIPLVDTVRYSFFEYFRSGIKEIGPNFIGMANYISLLKSDMFKYGANTLILWLIGFVPQIVVALVLAAWFFETSVSSFLIKSLDFFGVINPADETASIKSLTSASSNWREPTKNPRFFDLVETMSKPTSLSCLTSA